MKNLTIWVLMLLFGGSVVPLLAQSSPVDHLFRDFKSLVPDPNIGKISPLDVAVRQDGLVILAANQGVITYDGERWKRLEHPKYRRCTSVAVDSRGVIYVGFDADFGILEPSPEDGFRFRSLVAEFTELGSTPPICLRIEMHDDKIYFGCTIGIAIWNAKSQTPERWKAIEAGYKAQSYWLGQGTLHAAIVNDQAVKKMCDTVTKLSIH